MCLFYSSVVDPDSLIPDMDPDPDPVFQVNLDTDPDQGWWPKTEGKKAEIFYIFFWSKIAIYLFLGLYKGRAQATGEAFSSQKRTSSTLKMTFVNFFIFLWLLFALLDTDQGPHWIWIRIHNTVLLYVCRYSTTALTGQVWSWNDAPATERGEGRREKGRQRVPPIRRSWGAAFSQS
jgi:hypothetical protein